jgi:HAMP domain-containing protein
MDLVERLRLGGPNAWEMYGEAADEIERLRTEVTRLRAGLNRANRLLCYLFVWRSHERR